MDSHNHLTAEQLYIHKPLDLDVATTCQVLFAIRPTTTPFIEAYLYYLIIVCDGRSDRQKKYLLFSAIRALKRTNFDPPWSITDIIKYGYDTLRNVILHRYLMLFFIITVNNISPYIVNV